MHVGEGLRRRHGDAVAGVHAHGVDVLDGTDDDDVVSPVAHDLKLELLPADHGFLQQHLADGARGDAVLDDAAEGIQITGDAAAITAKGKARPDDDGQLQVFQFFAGFLDRLGEIAARHPEADALDAVAEELALLGALDGLVVGADKLDAELLEHARLVKFGRQVERRLAAQRRQQRVGTLQLDNGRDRRHVQRFYISARGEVRVGHDRRRVGVDQDDLVALLQQHPASLGARVVELAGLADDDRTRADQHNLVDVVTARHQVPFTLFTTMSFTKSSNR